jgi:hypothetical protein
MPEFLVRLHDAAKYTRVQARDEFTLMVELELECVDLIAFSSNGTSFKLELGKPLTQAQGRLPMLVRLAWFGVRFPRVRSFVQLVCWFSLGLFLTLGIARAFVAPEVLIVVGVANILVWWWYETEQRIEPVVLKLE